MPGDQDDVVIEIEDGHLDHDGEKIKIRVQHDGVTVYLMPVGYGSAGMAKGRGSPVFLELYEGRLRAVVNTDINDENALQIIDLEGTREDLVTNWDD